MISEDERRRIVEEEAIREAVRQEIKEPSRSKSLLRFLNQPIAIWFLTSIVVAVLSFGYRKLFVDWPREADKGRRLCFEIYNDAQEFIGEADKAWTRYDYESAFARKIQHPTVRIVSFPNPSMDLYFWELQGLGGQYRANVEAARWAVDGVWQTISQELGGLTYHEGLTRERKERLDQKLQDLIGFYLLEPFQPWDGKGTPSSGATARPSFNAGRSPQQR